jgi:NADH-ubiquinone oxidoreductase chain 4L
LYLYLIIITLSLYTNSSWCTWFSLIRRNLLILLISIELKLLGVTLMIFTSAHDFNDSTGHTFNILIIATAGAKSAIGLGVLVAY